MNVVPLYRRVLGEAWHALPPPVRAMHDGVARARGVADVERGRGPVARLAAAILRLPASGHDVAVEVTFRQDGTREVWTRNFAGRAFSSVQFEGTGYLAGLIGERFGPLAFGLALTLDGDRLRLSVPRWSLFGIPLPHALAPVGDSHETVDAQDRFRFYVEIGFRWTGLIVRYSGWLTPDA